MEEEFYATLKLKTGEELFCKVCASEEDDRTLLLVSHPITVQEIKNKIGIIGYKVEPWLKTTDEDLFIINLEDILTMSCLLYTSPSPRDRQKSRMPSSA